MKALFDWDFQSFLTPKIIQGVYIFAVLFGAIAVVILDVLALLHLGTSNRLPWQFPGDLDYTIFGAVLVSPVIYFVGVAIVRVFLESVMVFFSIAESLKRGP